VRRSYAMIAPPEGAARAGSRSAELVVCTPSLEVSVRTTDGRVRAVDRTGAVVLEDPDGGAYFRAKAAPKGSAAPVDVVGVVHRAAADERFYGLGLKTGASLDRRGGVFEMWTTDAYDDTVKGFRPDADPVYEAVPFTLGVRGGSAYGLLTDVLYRVRVDVAK